MRRTGGWGVLERVSDNNIDGARERLMGRYYGPTAPKAPDCMAGYSTMVFRTRADVRAWINEHYGYLRSRPDLRAYPHGWLMPVPVKVEVTVCEVKQ